MSDCILWDRYRNKDGYGIRKVNGRTQLAHRVAWEEANGTIPPDLCVCHHCDNPPCVNVEHLFLATHEENMADMASKGRSCAGEAKPHRKLNRRTVNEIRRRVHAGEMQKTLAAEFGIARPHVSQIVAGKYWK